MTMFRRKLNFDLLNPTPGFGGGGGGGVLCVKYLLPCCCICDSLKVDMHHDNALKMLNFTPRVAGGEASAGKIFATMLLHS